MNNSFNFGYPTKEPCSLCGAKPAEVEPRFGYVVCEEHSKLSPIEVDKYLQSQRLTSITAHESK